MEILEVKNIITKEFKSFIRILEPVKESVNLKPDH